MKVIEAPNVTRLFTLVPSIIHYRLYLLLDATPLHSFIDVIASAAQDSQLSL
jgi:hypothetical protein